MPTQCSAEALPFAPVAGRAVVANFDGGAITSDAGALLLDQPDRAIRLVERFAACFHNGRHTMRTEHGIAKVILSAGCGRQVLSRRFPRGVYAVDTPCTIPS